MPAPIYPTNVPLIVDGSSVSAETINPSFQALMDRTAHLKHHIDNLVIQQQALVAFNARVADTVTSERVVFFNATTGIFEPAFANLVIQEGAIYKLSPGSFALGIATNIIGTGANRTADIILRGVANLRVADISASGFEQGRPYYLTNNSAQAGRITFIKPALEIFILSFVGPIINHRSRCIINIDIKNLGENHLHYKFSLPVANFVSFGALGAHRLYPASLLNPFPPIPYESAILNVNGMNRRYGPDFEIIPDGVVYYTTHHPFPPPAPQAIELFYSQPASLDIPVTSLVAGTGNVTVSNNFPGGPPNFGALQIRIINVLDVAPNIAGNIVVKNITSNTTNGRLEINTGPIVETLVAGENIRLSPTTGQGTVSIRAFETPREVQVFDRHLIGASTVATLGDISYIRFPVPPPAGILQLKILQLAGYNRINFRISYIGEAGSTTATSAPFVLRNILINTGAILPGVSTGHNFALPFTSGYSANTLQEVNFELIALPGLFCFALERLAGDYTGGVGIVNIRAQLLGA